MPFDEIIQKLRDRDNKVTDCFFFWEGPTLAHIEEIRRTDPQRVANMSRPICNTCRPLLLKILNKVYGDTGFDYKALVSEFYFYLIDKDRLATITDSRTLMGWIQITALRFFLNLKNNTDKELENEGSDSLINVGDKIEDDKSCTETADFVQRIIAAMPNKFYSKIIDDVTLEADQYKGRQKAEFRKRKAEEYGITIENLYVKESLAKKQFKETAIKLNNN